MRVPFGASRKLVNIPFSQQPTAIKNLLKVTPNWNANLGNGARTLESIVSYMALGKHSSEGRSGIRRRYGMRTSGAGGVNGGVGNAKLNKLVNDLNINRGEVNDESSPKVNIVVCVSVRDFPLGVHQKLFALLALHRIDVECVHWVITDVDLLDVHYVLNSDDTHNIVNEQSYNSIRDKFAEQLRIYANYIKEKTKGKESGVSHRSQSALALTERIRNWDILDSNVHLFSKHIPFTVGKLMPQLHYDILNRTHTYVIGQTNVGKTTLVREMLRFVGAELGQNDGGIDQYDVSDWEECVPVPTPFASSFSVHKVPGMNIVDTPGFVRRDGGIWSHVSKYGAHMLRVTDKEVGVQVVEDLKRKKSVMVKPILFHEVSMRRLFKGNGVNIGDILFLKPWMVIPRGTGEDSLLKLEKGFKVSISKNFSSHVHVAELADIGSKMTTQENKVLSQAQLQWTKYAVNGTKLDLVFDNIGTVTVEVDMELQLPFNVCWEITIPERVRFLQREWIADGTPRFSAHRPVEAQFPRYLNGLVKSVRNIEQHRV